MNNIHYAPGRVRFRFAGLRNEPRLADAVQRTIRRLDGVKLVQVNVITGSLLVHYEPRGHRETALLSAIDGINDRFGLRTSPQPPTGVSTKPRSGRPAQADALVDTFLGMAFEEALERTAIALVGALI